MRTMNRTAVALAGGVLAVTGSLAVTTSSASAAPAPRVYENCPTSGSEWTDLGAGRTGWAHATCSGADVRIKVYCANGRSYDASPWWKGDYNSVSCPRGVGATGMYTSYRM
jgi:hypothetical protein